MEELRDRFEVETEAFFGHVTEIMVGFSLACILTLAFMGELHSTGRVALVMFCASIPCLCTARVARHLMSAEGSDLDRLNSWFETLGISASIVAFFPMLLQVW
jgi:predicted membrane channel-forming protein YqfA (hemolysin III family)